MTNKTRYRIKPDRVITSTLKKSVAAILGDFVSSPALGLQEGLPGHPLFPDRIKSVFEQDPFNRISPDLVAQVVESPSNSGVAPTRILTGHPENQLPDFNCGFRTTGSSAFAAVVLSRDQLPIPSEQSVRSHQGLYLNEPSSADLLGL